MISLKIASDFTDSILLVVVVMLCTGIWILFVKNDDLAH